ncbi:MAG: hypothetical protein ACC682_06530 [Gemmatimonadota bacterium]
MTGRAGIARLLGLGLLGLAAACGDAGTEPGSPPTRLVVLSTLVDTVVTGESTNPPLAVRVEDALGNPVEGSPVRFTVTKGPGAVAPAVAVSDFEGVAESTYEASGSPGDATIRADVPSSPNLEGVDFLVVAEAADSVLLQLSEGNEQRAEVGSQLPIPFTVRVATPAGSPAGGISIAFRIDAGGRSAVLTSDSVLTGPDGTAKTLLSLGRDAGEYAVSAFATRGVFSDTIRFRATATTSFEGRIVLDSVAGGGALVAGTEATLHGRGFSPIASENDVRIEGASARVLAATGTRLTIVVPTFGGVCLPVREVGVRVLVDDDASNGSMLTLEPPQPVVRLDVGGVETFRGPEAVSCIQFGPGEDQAEYVIEVGSVDRRVGQSVSARLTTRVPSDLGSSSVPRALAPRPMDPGSEQEIQARYRLDSELRANVLSDLIASRRPAAARGPPPTPSTTSVPFPGDTLRLNFAVQGNLTATCAQPGAPIVGVVRAVGEHLALVEDTDAPPDGFGPEEWDQLLAELDGVVAPVDTAYFGAYEDLDRNGRVVVLFTPRVNGLSRAGQGELGGFFLPLDLAAVRGGLAGPGGGCPASNEGEFLYVAVPDVDGTAGPAIPVARAIRNARRVTAHELQHLINAQGRITNGQGGFAAAEDVWLDEALSGLAEEVSGLEFVDQTTRAALTYDQVTGSRLEVDAFRSFHVRNFLNASLFLSDPSSAPTIEVDDPGGRAGLQMRGFGWLLLRWLGDQSGGDERALFRQIVTGGRSAARGIANIEQATARPWGELLPEFGATVAADGLGGGRIGERFRILTWESRDVFESLAEDAATGPLFPQASPLRPTRLTPETVALDFDVRASTMRYFTLAPGVTAVALALTASTPAETHLSETSEPQITIVRIR